MLYGYDDAFLARERVSNEYSMVNPLYVLRESIDFLTQGKISRDRQYTLHINYCDLYRHDCVVALPGEEYPFRNRYMKIIRSAKYVKLITDSRTEKDDRLSDVASYFEDKSKYKILSIIIDYRRDRFHVTRTLYSCNLYNMSYRNREVHSKACQTISAYWKDYQKRKQERERLFHKRKYEEVIAEIECLPSGGYDGKLLSFTGGLLYKRSKARFMAE